MKGFKVCLVDAFVYRFKLNAPNAFFSARFSVFCSFYVNSSWFVL